MLGLVLGLLGLLYYSTVNRKAVSRIRKKGALLCKLSYIKSISVLLRRDIKAKGAVANVSPPTHLIN